MHYLGTGSDRGCKGDKVLVRREEDGKVLRDFYNNAGWSVPGFVASDTDRARWQR